MHGKCVTPIITIIPSIVKYHYISTWHDMLYTKRSANIPGVPMKNNVKNNCYGNETFTDKPGGGIVFGSILRTP